MKFLLVTSLSALALLLAGVILTDTPEEGDDQPRTGVIPPPSKLEEERPDTQRRITYDFAHPSVEIRLPRRLREISALSMDESGNLLAVEDETGLLFVIDPGTGEIIRQQRFQSGGDYEGVEQVGDRVLVLRSSGHLFTIEPGASNSRSTKRKKLDLPGDCDAEALGYDDLKGILLVGCKTGDGVRGRRGRSIFAFDSLGVSLSDEPYLFIDDDLLATACGDCGRSSRSFHPSALAVHPSTRELYILSAVNELLLIYSPDSSNLIRLKLDRLPQPEGITFDRNGVLYIASEGQSRKATLYVFNPIEH